MVDKLVMVEVRKIKPYHRNPRRNDATVQRLVELIPKVGFNVPLVLDRSNVIVKGHTRWKAAIRLGMTELPVVYTDADPEAIKLDRLADNRVHEFTTWDEEVLREELGDLAKLGLELDLKALNFAWQPPVMEPLQLQPAPEPEPLCEVDDIAGLEREAEPEAAPAPDDPEPAAVGDYIEVNCAACGHTWFVPR
jgi:ParB-like chromosome segregation protein Spo0J